MKRGRFSTRSTRGLAAVGAILLAAGLLQVLDVNPAASQSLSLVARAAGSDPGLDPASPAWDDTAAVQVSLTAQPGAYAAGGGSIPTLSARALHFEETLYIRVEWDDPTEDGATARPEDFADAVAVEFPARAATSVPSICMGQADQGVNIWQWRADSEAGVDAPLQVFSNGFVDWYPDEDDVVWYPARAAGNPFAQPDAGPVQDLVAQAFGTIAPSSEQAVTGRGVYADGKWTVVLARPFSVGDAAQAEFATGAETDMAFAVWNGSEGDRDGIKAVSTFVKLSLSAAVAGGGGGDSDTFYLLLALVLLVGLSAIGGVLALVGSRQR